ncbi:YkvA family protein [Pararhizobium sp. YC-54]|uniref:YkvA family protein n=1 Tax=Pararhizobium sp. YC-54 TaxID=2986920 RepID=UPI0021F6D72B|nr:YkvA family protein [Pararhizobium sp. YC-54]MCV9996849.1 YkvA family protein [Pararhizobium sp. YC-54]
MVFSAFLENAKRWARQIKRDVVALWIAARDRRTPLAAKLVAGAVAAYALSPIDLIPDFIPVFGYLDDLLIVPLGILLAVKLVPVGLMVEFRAAAARRESRPVSRVGLAVIIAIWLCAAALIIWWIWGGALGRWTAR